MGQGARVAQLAATRGAIEDAALELFRLKGFDGVDVAEIAERAGVSRRTFFRHFEQKSEVVVGRGREHELRLRDIIRHRPSRESAARAVERTMVEFSRWVESERSQMLTRAHLIMAHRDLVKTALFIEAQWANALAEELAERTSHERPTIEDRMLGFWGVAAHMTGVAEWAAAEGQTPLHELTEQALAVKTRG